MAYNYPIWHEVSACHYKSSKSYGGVKDSGERIYVGTSAKNSHFHCKILTTKRDIDHQEFGKCLLFRTSIDDVVVKETLVSVKERAVVSQKSMINETTDLLTI